MLTISVRFLRRAITGVFLLAAMFAPSPASAWEMVVCADRNAPPLSTFEENGLENRIAEIIADELGATVTYVWAPLRRAFEFLREGNCDVVMGIPDGTDVVLATVAYYRSPYVFIHRASDGFTIQTFDDPELHELKIGVLPSDSPAHHAMLRRGLSENIVLQTLDLVAGGDNPFRNAVAALADGTIDVAVVWGPAGGFFSGQQAVEMIVTPVPPFDPPFTPMFINMVAGVRHGDDFLRDLLDIALVARWDEIQSVLVEMGVPRMDLIAPILTLDTAE
jgi:mxaJ protein